MNEDYTNREQMEIDARNIAEEVDKLDSSDLPTANIMVAGITGSGKSTLINAVFGEDFAETGSGRPVTQNMNEYSNKDIPIRIWDTVGLELDTATTQNSIRQMKEKIAEKSDSKNQFDRIHAIWYCVNSRSSRYQGAELDFIKSFHSIGVPFIIVLTQCIEDVDEVNAFEREIRRINENMGLNDIDVVQVCAKDFKMRGVPPIPAFGLDILVDLTTKKLPAFIKNGFIAAQRVSKIQKRELCEKTIIRCVQEAKEGFWDKVFLANIRSANKRIKDMFRELGEIYNTQIPEESIENIIETCRLDGKNIFWGLLSPIDFGYNKNVMQMLDSKKNEEGFSSIDPSTFTKSDRVAVMVAFYGYTIIDSLEEVWETLTQSQLKNIDMFCNEMIRIINRKLNERQKRAKQWQK